MVLARILARPVAAVAVVAAAAGGCTPDADRLTERGPMLVQATPAYGDTYIDSLLGDISSLIPTITSDGASHTVGSLLYSGLIRYDKNLSPEGDLAKSWEFSSDCRQLTFRLRPGVKWHDGRPFTADDVVFTWQTTVDPKTPSPYKADFLDVESVRAEGPDVVHVHYRQPYAKALTSWATWILPRHLLEPFVREGRIREAPQNWNAPVGTGPYRFVSRRAGERIVLVANQDYWEGRPNLSRVVYRVIPSQATIFLELKANGVDSAALTALQYKRQTDYPAFKRAYNKFSYPSSAYTYLGFNLKDPRFADRRVRQAFAHAINKRELIDGVILGMGREATGPYKPGTWAYTDKVKTYPYDMERARALLAEAGWKERNGDGLLVKDGRPFTFELLTNQGNDERKKIAEIIQAQLRELGVGVEIRILEWAALLKENIRKRRFEAIVLGWGTGIDPDQFVVWHSSQTAPDQMNHISYANPEVDAALEQGRASCVQADRVKYYHRLQEVLAEDQPIVFLYFREALPVVSSRIYGIDPGPNGIGFNFPKWFVPRQLQRYTAG
ncbi:MAG TPA: peptide-binding protein [Methylomirabilota bacterium]|jgi:peptide/nickel transport system substrate-binding protein|nr:peptide-binding protein [Methylomirabilota bacterium]